MNNLTKRLILLAAILAIGAVVWFMLGESENVTAGESKAPIASSSSGGSISDGGQVLARVNGTDITRQAVEDSVAGQLIKMERDRHDLIGAAVETQVQETLLVAEAEKRGITRLELIAAEVDAKLGEVPSGQVDAFYEARKQQIRAPKEQVEPQIRRFLQFENYVGQLRSGAEIEVLTQPFRVEVEAVGPSKGPEDALVTIVEFSDFECPFCGRVNPSLKKVVENYGDKVRVVFRQFPLDIHPNARKAGEASLCAEEQGEFWPMHDAMFADQKNLAVAGLKSIAAGISGLDAGEFNECLDSGKFAETVENDLQAGARVGVASTPAFFVNGRYLAGAQSFDAFAAVIDDELKRVGGA